MMDAAEFKLIRKSLKLTQAELAHWLGYSHRERVAEFERGAPIPPLLERLMRAYGRGYMPPEYFKDS